jgi:hypothetical protein
MSAQVWPNLSVQAIVFRHFAMEMYDYRADLVRSAKREVRIAAGLGWLTSGVDRIALSRIEMSLDSTRLIPYSKASSLNGHRCGMEV